MSDELKHFGIPGMRWGVRRKRTSGSDGGSEDHRTARAIGKKKLADMSNSDLKTLNARLQLEKQYKELTATQQSAGQKYVSEILASSGKQIASKFIADQVNSQIAKLFKKS